MTEWQSGECITCKIHTRAFFSFQLLPLKIHLWALQTAHLFSGITLTLNQYHSLPTAKRKWWFSSSTHKLSPHPWDCGGAHFPLFLWSHVPRTSRPRPSQKPLLRAVSWTLFNFSVHINYLGIVLYKYTTLRAWGRTWQHILAASSQMMPTLCGSSVQDTESEKDRVLFWGLR